MQDLPRVLLTPVSERDHIRGSLNAPVMLVEYGDYECPYCRAAEPLVEALEGSIGDYLCIAFRHFPVASVHPHAEHAAEAAEAAAAQGQFWQMHRLLFAHQSALDDASLLDLARNLGLDIAILDSDLNNHAYRHRVREDLTDGLKSGVRGTPTFFIDGLKFDGPPDLQEMHSLILRNHPEIAQVIAGIPMQIRVPSMTPHDSA